MDKAIKHLYWCILRLRVPASIFRDLMIVFPEPGEHVIKTIAIVERYGRKDE